MTDADGKGLRGARLVGIGYLMVASGDPGPRCYQLTLRPTFPQPAGEPGLGRVWRRADVAQWITVYRPDEANKPNSS
ncbi:hypothetical protein [Pseudofrankia sp. DC12]|uniref:hypothetical protein n=1 Tax=Pseudofrankia sp. DC12 TaxID=683315 RepID=UPI000A022BBE|nr:hypothetical protein [Pseudofrankia sp. DC12]